MPPALSPARLCVSSLHPPSFLHLGLDASWRTYLTGSTPPSMSNPGGLPSLHTNPKRRVLAQCRGPTGRLSTMPTGSGTTSARARLPARYPESLSKPHLVSICYISRLWCFELAERCILDTKGGRLYANASSNHTRRQLNIPRRPHRNARLFFSLRREIYSRPGYCTTFIKALSHKRLALYKYAVKAL